MDYFFFFFRKNCTFAFCQKIYCIKNIIQDNFTQFIAIKQRNLVIKYGDNVYICEVNWKDGS